MSLPTVKRLPADPDYLAPDGSEVRVLADGERGGLAHFTLPPGRTSQAVRHRMVEEIWYITAGQGELWRGDGHGGRIDRLEPGVSFVLPPDVPFQFRNTGEGPLEILGVTMPRWPGPDEAMICEGAWAGD